MKISERIQRNMQNNKPMTLISLRLSNHVIEDLKEVTPSLGFRTYISGGLRKHLAEREDQQVKDNTVEEFSPPSHCTWCLRASCSGCCS